MRVQGGGHVHATHVSIAAGRLTVDDLGTITGDLHTIPCTVGQGKDGISGSGNFLFKNTFIIKHKCSYLLYNIFKQVRMHPQKKRLLIVLLTKF